MDKEKRLKSIESFDYWRVNETGIHNKKIHPNNFIIEIPSNMNPFSINYKNYWKEQKRKCIEGYWFEGKWMPGNLYFYINFTKILLNLPGSKGKTLGRPFLRDIEWEKAYIYQEARGFSGFEEDDTITCLTTVYELEKVKDNPEEYKEKLDLLIIDKSAYKKDGTFKTYVHPRDYLRRIHPRNYGKPIYKNNASNVIDIEARRMGKSYFSAGGLITHNFLFDGTTNYDAFIEGRDSGNIPSSETLVGAIDSKYSQDLLNKTKLALENLRGNTIFNGIERPSPFAKQVRGSLLPGKFIEAAYEQKLPGGWVTKGSRSKIHHRTFADNPLAGNGTGPNLIALEEVGFFNNIVETFSALTDATKDGLNKFGTIYMFGTGGSMNAGISDGIMDIFFNPEKYDCLSFNDIWEGNGNIGFFVPYQFKFDEYRDEYGTVDLHKASKIIDIKREKLFKSKDRYKLQAEQQNNPENPSEAFLIPDSNIFPTGELKLQKQYVLSKMITDGDVAGECGKLIYDPVNAKNVKWIPDLEGKLTPTHWNMSKSENSTGCIQIWEHPYKNAEGITPWGCYYAGLDPIDQDQSTTTSLGSTIIYKNFIGADQSSHRIVAEYTARPETAKEHHENVLKLLMYYNAECLYENERNTIIVQAKHTNRQHYFAKQPTILKALENTSVHREFGIHMTAAIKNDMILLLNDWLLEENSEGGLNLNTINSIPILDELINYNDKGNFDRVIALLLVITLKNQNYRIKVDVHKKKVIDKFFISLDKYYK